MLEHDLPIVAETELPVVHNLLALPGIELSAIRRVFSHPQALAQCEMFLQTLPGVEIVATYDTAGSARMIRDGGLKDTAAIASARAAELFGLTSLRDRHPGLRRQHHAVPAGRAGRARRCGHARQDVARVRAAQRPGRAVQGAQRVRAARHRPDEARVAAGARAGPGSTSSTPISRPAATSCAAAARSSTWRNLRGG